MATTLDFITELEAKVIATASSVAAIPHSRLPQDYHTEQSLPVANSEAYFQIRVHHVEDSVISSAENHEAIECELHMHWRASQFSNDFERNYINDSAHPLQSALLKRDWWREMASVYDFWANGVLQIADPIELTGKVYSYQLTSQLWLAK